MVAPLIGAAARMAAKKAAKKAATQTGEEALEKFVLGTMIPPGAAAAAGLGQEISERYHGRGSYDRRLNEQQQARDELDKKEREAKAEVKRESRGTQKGNSGGADSDGMKKGGSVSSASKRADGCAMRGKTKGRMV